MKSLASLFLAASLTCCAATPTRKLSSELRSQPGQSSVRVIVQWNTTVGESTTAQKITSLGGTVISEFSSVHSGVYVIPVSALDSLEADTSVRYVSVDRTVRKKAGPLTPSVLPPAGITPAAINAPAAWSAGYMGAGIAVAIVDSGINQSDNLGISNQPTIYTEDFTVAPATKPNGKPGPKPASYGLDWFGHGQHIAGIIASNAKESDCPTCTQLIAGISPAVNLINLKVLDVNGEGSDSAVIAAIDRAISLKTVYNIRVINLSLGRPVYESYTQDPLCQAVEAAWQAGIVVVVSAGNDGRDSTFGNSGYGTINAPGNDPYVITVGAMKSMGTATRTDDLIASYSSKGPTSVDHIVKPDLVAPGNQIISLLAQNGTLPLANPQNFVPLSMYQNNAPQAGIIPIQPTYNGDGTQAPPNVNVGPGYSTKYYILNGTSMATAVVSGAVADLLSANPSLTPDQIKILLMQTSSKSFPTMSTVVDSTSGQLYNSYYDIFTVGAGYLDLQAALSLVRQVPSGYTAISPVASLDTTSGEVDVTFDPSSYFSNPTAGGANSLSSNRVMWGADTTWSNAVLSSNRVMWGADSLSADRATWGASGIFSSRALWGASSMTSSQSTMIDGEQ